MPARQPAEPSNPRKSTPAKPATSGAPAKGAKSEKPVKLGKPAAAAKGDAPAKRAHQKKVSPPPKTEPAATTADAPEETATAHELGGPVTQALVRVLDEIGAMMELLGEDSFKANAHTRAARTIRDLAFDLSTLGP